jgi:RNA polymerase sigma-70 factor (ECF subfamily)
MTMLDERLRAADPARDVPDYPDMVAAAMLAAATSTRRVRRPWGRWAAVAAAVLAAALLLTPGLSPLHTGATAEAAGLLDRAIIAAVDPQTRPDQYWKVTTSSITRAIIGEGEWGTQETASFLRRSERVAFIAVDGSRPTWFVDRSGPYVSQVSGPRQALPDAGWSEPDAWTTNVAENRAGGIDILGLPRDPTLLRVRLYLLATGRGHGPDDEVVVIVGDILRTGYAPADLRKALFEVLKTVPGMGVATRDVTLDGRRGVALGRTEPTVAERRELVFSADTGEYIGDREIITDLAATTEDAISRELVDAVDPDVVHRARREHCEVGAGGAVTCRER